MNQTLTVSQYLDLVNVVLATDKPEIWTLILLL